MSRFHFWLAVEWPSCWGSCLTPTYALLLMASLWWPARKNLAKVFTIKRGASAERLVFDLHRVVGFYSLPMLSMLAFSGTYLVYPDYIDPIAKCPTGARNSESRMSRFEPVVTPLTLEQAIFVARQVFPEAEVKRVLTPEGHLGSYKVTLRQPEEIFKTAYPETQVWIDQYRGVVLVPGHGINTDCRI